MQNHENLPIWKKSMELTTEIYKTTYLFPKDEFIELAKAIKKTAIAIPTMIAQGCQESSTEEISHLIQCSASKLNVLESNFLIAQNINAILKHEAQPIINDIEELRKMIHIFLKSLHNK